MSEKPTIEAKVSGSNCRPGAITVLYVADLHHDVSEGQLYDIFNQFGEVFSVHISHKTPTTSLRYALVTFTDSLNGFLLVFIPLLRFLLSYHYFNPAYNHAADKAMEQLNCTPLYGIPIRIMPHRDFRVRNNRAANLIIKNLDKTVDHETLRHIFSNFGTIVSYKVATYDSGESKGYGFVQFESEQSAKDATYTLNGKVVNGKEMRVSPFVRKENTKNAPSGDKSKNVYVRNLSYSTTGDDLKRIFGEYGTITSALVIKDSEGASRRVGIVKFENVDDAAKAVEALNGKRFDGFEWCVGKANRQSERLLELKEINVVSNDEGGQNLHVNNLADGIGDVELNERFSQFDTITPYKNQCTQMRPVPMAPSVATRMPQYSLRPPPMGQQYLYGKRPPSFIPQPQPQGGLGYQQHYVPRMRPDGVVRPRPNFFVPGTRAVGQHPGGHRGAGPTMSLQPLAQQQMLPRISIGHRNYPPDPRADGMGGLGLATALTNASPEHQREMLYEALYPLVEKLEHDSAAKVTDVLLELDQPEGAIHRTAEMIRVSLRSFFSTSPEFQTRSANPLDRRKPDS
ncbi:hypothetical protein Fmac_000425 [Flemingia macrophylla]|uniref:Polyadenylate-binding protein n=1 Tax=Flemingia macrophylla TaxID=520843 RepID=A0ABD1NE84_9FABA